MGCSGEQSPYNDAFASSYFKMSKMFGLRGVNQGAAYGVQTQPCQVRGGLRFGGEDMGCAVERVVDKGLRGARVWGQGEEGSQEGHVACE
jgi:hypothetical protein